MFFGLEQVGWFTFARYLSGLYGHKLCVLKQPKDQFSGDYHAVPVTRMRENRGNRGAQTDVKILT